MTFVPQQWRATESAAPFRRIKLWILIIVLATLLWEVGSGPKSEAWLPMMIVLAGVLVLLVGWTVMYLHQKRSARGKHSTDHSSNRPIG